MSESNTAKEETRYESLGSNLLDFIMKKSNKNRTQCERARLVCGVNWKFTLRFMIKIENDFQDWNSESKLQDRRISSNEENVWK